MSRLLLENLSEINRQISAAPHILLFTDFDGTLTPIGEHPHAAQLAPETKTLLEQLFRQSNMTLAVISGRALADIQTRVGIEGLVYAGNHGLEICGPGFHFIDPEAAAQREALQQLAEKLSARMQAIAGACVENKGLTVSIHFRQVADKLVDQVVRVVRATVTPRHRQWQLTVGKMVYEIRPRVDWHKGAALHWIKDRVGKPKALTIYLGDDFTDEDAFAALPDGITVKVGHAEETLAKFCVANPAEVQQFLQWLLERNHDD
ncbi:trehalose-phosphatase [candidate division KSB1 bacterium]|nr:trehalose-phosphatase [candidate division KSB1 bacterium]